MLVEKAGEEVTGNLAYDTCRAAQLVMELALDAGAEVSERDLGMIATAIGEWLRERGLAESRSTIMPGFDKAFAPSA